VTAAAATATVHTSRQRPPWAIPAIAVGLVVVYFFLLTFVLTLDPKTSGHAPQIAIQQVANALSIGAIYALIALGYTMVYGIIELINFAHGDVFMMGAFLAVLFAGAGAGSIPGLLHLSGPVENPVLLVIYMAATLAVVMPVTGLLNLTIERIFYRPFRGGSRLAPLITAVGVSFILQNVALVLFGSGDRNAPQIFPLTWRIDILGASVPVLNFVILLIALTLMYILQTFVRRTRLGRAMRATALDQQASKLMGVDVNQTIALTFAIGGALAGAAGTVWGYNFGFVRQDLGFNAGLKSFTSAVLGGIGNITGAVLGGFVIGFVENFCAALGLTRWAEFSVFVALTLVLVFRPAGILGQQVGERA
jgi:branched-chain amino acid transport system permease protein